MLSRTVRLCPRISKVPASISINVNCRKPSYQTIRRLTEMGTCRVKSLDHLVLTVKDLHATVNFYKDLGMTHSSFTSGSSNVYRNALSFGEQKINLHISGKEFEPKAMNVQPGSGDLCFLIEDNVDDVLRRLKDRGEEILEGGKVVERTGARGKLRSVYLRDPDGNLVELSNMV